MPQNVDSGETIQVPSVSKRPPKTIHRKALCQVITARYEELFALIQNEIRRSGFEDLITAGVVLTGGASNVEDAVELAESIFKMPVRMGVPQNISGLVDVRENPSYATGVGLLLHGLHHTPSDHQYDPDQGVKGLWTRMKGWFQGNF